MQTNLKTIGVATLAMAFAADQAQLRPRVIVPETNHAAMNWGWPTRAQTNFFILDGETEWRDTMSPLAGPFASTPYGYSPAALKTAYNLPSLGGSKIIAIVDAYHYPTALNDFNVFASQFGLPKELSTSSTASTNKVFQVVYASGSKPPTSAGWSQEMALDIEWAHAMAPKAKIILVEAASASFSSLSAAVKKAASIAGVGEVSMSWGAGEFSGESSWDGMFNVSTVCYFASSGDTGGVLSYPACSPRVVSVGGTSLKLDAFGNCTSETAWSGSGSGVSLYEARPAFQSGLSVPGKGRCSADISLVADPYTGVAVYDSTAANGYSGWMVFGGTSLSCPLAAGLHNVGGSFRGTALEQTYIYANFDSPNFRDITSGTAGKFVAGAGYDLPTGAGAPLGLLGL